MDTLYYLGIGFGVALTPYNLLTAFCGTLIGTIVGLLPGLGPVNGVALLIPIAFALGLPPETALILLAAVYLGCEYGGRISSILLNIPGEASTVMTTLDGYPMARKGLAGVALSLSAWSSFIGAFIATCGMVLFAPLLAKWAVAFGPAEYFVLMVFAIASLGGMVGDKPVKTLLSALIGLAVLCVLHRVTRSPFGHVLVAIRENQQRATFQGYDVERYKLLAFMVSAFYTGVAGGLFGFVLGFFDPFTFTLLLSIIFLVMVVVGIIGFFNEINIGAFWYFVREIPGVVKMDLLVVDLCLT